MSQLTVRNVSPQLGARLRRMSEARGVSVNALVLDILRRAAGIDERRERLRRAATWTEEDASQFEDALRAQRTIDEKLWG